MVLSNTTIIYNGSLGFRSVKQTLHFKSQGTSYFQVLPRRPVVPWASEPKKKETNRERRVNRARRSRGFPGTVDVTEF